MGRSNKTSELKAGQEKKRVASIPAMMKLSKIPAPKASNNNAKRVTGGDWVCHFSNCDKDFGDKSTLDRHIKTNHLKLSQVKCAAEGCGRLYSDKYTWQNHSKRTPGHDHCEKVKRNQAVLPTLPGKNQSIKNEHRKTQSNDDSSNEGIAAAAFGGMDITDKGTKFEDALEVNLNRKLGDMKFWATREKYTFKHK